MVETQLIKDCIGLLSEQGMTVHALVFDGSYTNQPIAIRLGCKLKINESQSWFPHPQNSYSRLYVIFDIHYMIKLMRNLLGDSYTICHIENGHLKQIEWQFIHSLNKLQEEIGFSFANKL